MDVTYEQASDGSLVADDVEYNADNVTDSGPRALGAGQQACSMFAATALRELQDADDPFPFALSARRGRYIALMSKRADHARPAGDEARVARALTPGERAQALALLGSERFLEDIDRAEEQIRAGTMTALDDAVEQLGLSDPDPS